MSARFWLAAILASLPGTVSAQLWSRPVTCPNCIFDYYYVDHGFSRDYSCANSTYSDHTGSDYSLRNGNFAIDDDNEVVAMAPGVVVSTQDGYYDRCTQCGGFNCGTGIGNGFANQVIINHGVHRVIYGHMKQGSVAVKQGDMVTCGQVIGFIGSSGCSTGAHLHIEPSLAAEFGVGPYRFIDPYVGECSPTESSLWSDQGAWRVLPGAACDGQPAVPACPADTYPIWTCLPDGSGRRRCVDGVVADEPCPGGCTVMPTGTDDVCELPPDGDGDGSRSDVDCDDADATRHPGVVESCGDGVDQDCSGADLVCAMPAAGSGGVGGAAGVGAGGASGPAGGVGMPGALQPGAAGSGAPIAAGGPITPAPTAGGPAPLPVLPEPVRAPEEAGCGVGRPAPAGHAGSRGLGSAIAALVLLALRRRRHR